MNTTWFYGNANPKHIFFQNHWFLQWIMSHFSKTSVFTMNCAPFSKVALGTSLTELPEPSPGHLSFFKLICQNWLAPSRGILGTQRFWTLPGRHSSFSHNVYVWVSFLPIPEWNPLQCWNSTFPIPSVPQTDCCYCTSLFPSFAAGGFAQWRHTVNVLLEFTLPQGREPHCHKCSGCGRCQGRVAPW